MSERAAYSRVYWSLVDDPKFASIYDDDACLATWLRLLLIADQAHPASANIPTGTRRKSVVALAEAGLIDLGTGSRYRVHGLDAEREKRALAATRNGPNRDPSGPQPGPRRDPTGIQTPGLRRDETRKDETRQVPAPKRAPERRPFSDPVTEQFHAAIVERYGSSDPKPPPTRLVTAAEQEREARRKEAFELSEQFQANRISEVEYQRRLRDIGKEPDDLTRAGA